MHLQTIRIRGFKSFVDPLELKLEPGVAVVVGPNGSGKSNVADAIVWAAGSLTPSELRAEKPDDVLFGGAANRPAADHCEVELVFDNEDGGFGDEVDFSEVAITRRLVRGGEGQYLVNKAAVRRTDLVELLADVGLGGSMHSIVSQGKVDAVLASRPEDRRHLVEEAAGLGKFKRRKHRAELKLARVATQIDRARDVEDEVRKRLRPLALQATAAERAEKLAVEIAALRARIAQLDLAAVAERRADAEARRDAVAIARRSAQEKLAELLAERERAEDELSDAAGNREAALGASTASRAQTSGSCCGASPRKGWRTGCVPILQRRNRPPRTAATAPFSSSRPRPGRLRGRRDAAEAHGQAAERARIAHARVAAFERRLSTGAESKLAQCARARGRRGSARRRDGRRRGCQPASRGARHGTGASGAAARGRGETRREPGRGAGRSSGTSRGAGGFRRRSSRFAPTKRPQPRGPQRPSATILPSARSARERLQTLEQRDRGARRDPAGRSLARGGW